MRKELILILVLSCIGCTAVQDINSYEECVAAGYPILESYPEQCMTPDGRSFTRVLPGFCGWSTNASCTNDSECVTGGCNGEVCQGIGEDIVTTCEYKECYADEILGVECGCVDEECEWRSV
jgi:eight-cysteine-cluster-containing protein